MGRVGGGVGCSQVVMHCVMCVCIDEKIEDIKFTERTSLFRHAI